MELAVVQRAGSRQRPSGAVEERLCSPSTWRWDALSVGAVGT
jgi:hypothetical protein